MAILESAVHEQEEQARALGRPSREDYLLGRFADAYHDTDPAAEQAAHEASLATAASHRQAGADARLIRELKADELARLRAKMAEVPPVSTGN